MKDISTVRKTVATMANQLHKLGYSLSQAFKTAWKRVKNSMKCRVASVTYEKRQQYEILYCCRCLFYKMICVKIFHIGFTIA